MERRGARDVTQFRLAPEVCKAGPFKGYTRLDWIHSAARKRPTEKVHALMHHFTVDNLRRAFQELDGSRAPGIDRVTKQEYKKQLQSNPELLHERIRKGGWRPQRAGLPSEASRRSWGLTSSFTISNTTRFGGSPRTCT